MNVLVCNFLYPNTTFTGLHIILSTLFWNAQKQYFPTERENERDYSALTLVFLDTFFRTSLRLPRESRRIRWQPTRANHSCRVSSIMGCRVYMGGNQVKRRLLALLMNVCPQDTTRHLDIGQVTCLGNYYPTRQIRCRTAKGGAIRTSASRDVAPAASHSSTCDFISLSCYVQFHCRRRS